MVNSWSSYNKTFTLVIHLLYMFNISWWALEKLKWLAQGHSATAGFLKYSKKYWRSITLTCGRKRVNNKSIMLTVWIHADASQCKRILFYILLKNAPAWVNAPPTFQKLHPKFRRKTQKKKWFWTWNLSCIVDNLLPKYQHFRKNLFFLLLLPGKWHWRWL